MQAGKIIAFDGNVCTGKTSVISELASRNKWNKLEEYSVFFNNNKILESNKDYLNTQRKYLLVDKKRKKHISKTNINLLDRSFVSTSAHVWALYKQGIVDIRGEYFKLLSELMDKNVIILPDEFVYTFCDLKIIKKRCRLRQKSLTKNKKVYVGTKYYIKEDYMNYISDFNKRFHRENKSFIINTSKLNTKEIAFALERKLCKTKIRKNSKRELKKALKKSFELINH